MKRNQFLSTPVESGVKLRAKVHSRGYARLTYSKTRMIRKRVVFVFDNEQASLYKHAVRA